MAEDKGAKGPDPGRAPLPGIPSYIDRVSAECIWKGFCNSEEEYLRKRTRQPAKVREHFGALHGFQVIKHPTYISCEKVNTPVGSTVSSFRESAVGDPTAAQSSMEWRTPTPAPRQPKPVFTFPNTQMSIPKYHIFSTDHMKELEHPGNKSRSGQGLKKAISTPVFKGLKEGFNEG